MTQELYQAKWLCTDSSYWGASPAMGSHTEETLELWVCPLSMAQPVWTEGWEGLGTVCSEAVLCLPGLVMAAPRKT